MHNVAVELLNTMISKTFEVFHVTDFVDEESTLYHHHDFYEIHCTVEGDATFFVEGREFQVSPGTLVLIPPNTLHRIVNQKSIYFERSYFFIHPQFLQSLSTNQSNLEQCFQQGRIIKIEGTQLSNYLNFFKQLPNNQFGCDLEYQMHFIHFLILLNRLAIQSNDGIIEMTSPKTDPLIMQTIDYISNNLNNDLSLKTTASKLFTNHYHLSREFKKQTGMTYHTFVIKKRLLYSKELLRIYRNATAVYSLCGFRSYTHFLRCFKTEFSITPKEFLKRDEAQQFIQFDHYENQ